MSVNVDELSASDILEALRFSLSMLTEKREAPFTCKYCGSPSWLDPVDQTPPPDYCHDSDHGNRLDGHA